DRRTAYRFAVNPAGVKKDVFHFNDVQEDVGWDAVWEAAARRDSLGWTAEMRIPLSQLRFSGGGAGERSWGVNFIRDVARLNERSYWSPMPPDASGFVSRLGELAGLTELASPRRLEAAPYTMARVTRAPDAPGDPFYRENDAFGTAGGDLRYGITSNLTLSATVNPDFGQVEADPSQVNLSAFESFFPEKRPFFLEGADIFRFDIGFPFNVRGKNFGNDQVFYSRRVGRAPQGFVPPGAAFADAPGSTRILGAAKVSGKTEGGWSVGLLDAVSAEESARFSDPGGARGRAVVEPLTNHAVARASRDFNHGGSAVGGIFSATHRRLDGTGLDWLRSSAYAAGVDGRHRFGAGNYEVRGTLLGSHVRGSPAAITRTQLAAGRYFQRPDADHVELDPERTGLSGLLADARVERIGGGPWRWRLIGHAVSPGFELNDAGFLGSPDWALAAAEVEYNRFTPGRLFQRWSVNGDLRSAWSWGGERRSTGAEANASFDLNSFWGGYVGGVREFGALVTDVLRGGPALRANPLNIGWWGFYSDRRRSWGVRMDGDVGVEEGTDLYWYGVNAGVDARAGDRLEISVSPGLNRQSDPWFCAVQPGCRLAGDPRYLFSRLEQTTLSLTTRLSYTFTPDLSLQLYAQPFVSAGDYSEYKEVVEPRARRFGDRFRVFPRAREVPDGRGGSAVDLEGDGRADFATPDFNVRELRSNAVLRWEYRPGSALFVVWSQGRAGFDPRGDFRLGRDVRRLWGADPTDVLLVKLSYWLDL
ncbi:MAG TPA: DUF5916 domain-containing protein, partial [Longimicrobiaceae bacterium]